MVGTSSPDLVEMFLVSLVSMADMIQVGRVGPCSDNIRRPHNQPMMLLQSVFQALT